jgi:hypothetical protein
VAYRYAILWEHEQDESRPAALVLGRDDHVFVDAPDELCIPSRWDEPFIVGSINGPFAVTYTPKDRQYFDQVLIDLSRTFSVGEQGMVPSASDTTVLRLLRDKILAPVRERQTVPYVHSDQGGQYETIRAYRRRYYSDPPRERVAEHEPPTAGAAEGSLVAA